MKDRIMEITQSEQQTKKSNEKNENITPIPAFIAGMDYFVHFFWFFLSSGPLHCHAFCILIYFSKLVYENF